MITTTTAIPTYIIILFLPPVPLAGWFGGLAGAAGPPAGAGDAAGGSGAGCGGSEVAGGWVVGGVSVVGFILLPQLIT